MAHDEPPHQDLRCLQIQLFSSLVVKELSHQTSQVAITCTCTDAISFTDYFRKERVVVCLLDTTGVARRPKTPAVRFTSGTEFAYQGSVPVIENIRSVLSVIYLKFKCLRCEH